MSFPFQPVRSMPVVEPYEPGDKPDMTKNVLSREWEQHFTAITNQFRDDNGTLATHTTEIAINTTDIATNTSDITTLQNQMASVWPIGAIFISAVATNPATLIGFGTWTAFGAGKFLVGIDGADPDFTPVLKTGGAKSASVADHSHDLSAHVHALDHTHAAGATVGAGVNLDASFTGDSGVANPDTTSSDGAGTVATVPPYIVCYFWRRTA